MRVRRDPKGVPPRLVVIALGMAAEMVYVGAFVLVGLAICLATAALHAR